MKINPEEVRGCILEESNQMAIASSGLSPFENDYWMDRMIPMTSQGGFPACVGYGISNAIECLVRDRIDEMAFRHGYQLDGKKLWQMTCDEMYDGVYSGVRLIDGVKIALKYGFLPPGTEIIPVNNDLGSISAALLYSPIVQGTYVWDDWSLESTITGCIEDPTSTPSRNSGHCTIIVGVRKLKDWRRVFANSWGVKWGRFGFASITDYAGVRYTMNLFAFKVNTYTGWNWEDLMVKVQ